MIPEENRQAVLKFMEAMATSDAELFRECCTSDVEWRCPGPPELIPVAGIHKGVDAFVAFLNEAKGEFAMRPEPRESDGMTIMNFMGDENCILVEHQARGYTRAGKDYHNYYALVFDLKDGKVQRLREYVDTLYAFHQGIFNPDM